ncbi:hypothetical protein HZC35_00675 [Candidatus Saganbacteria bacterium]|nr:hypothetical protein [Candidatus Saganbacteria bacterium]
MKRTDIYQELGVLQLFLSAAAGKRPSYFELTPFAARLIRFMPERLRPDRFPFSFGEVKDEKDHALYPLIFGDINLLCREIFDRETEKAPFFKELSGIYPSDKLRVFFKKVIHKEITKPVIYINILKWAKEEGVFHSKNSKYLSSLRAYGKKKGIIVAANYFGAMDILLDLAKALFAFMVFPLAKIKRLNVSRRCRQEKPIIASPYTAREITFDRSYRSDIFWLLDATIPYDQVLIQFERKDVPANPKMVSQLEEKGIKVIALSPKASKADIPVWRPTFEFFKTLGKRNLMTAKALFLATFRFDLKWTGFTFEIVMLNNMFAFWYDYFKTLNIKIYFSHTDVVGEYNIALHLALREAGGVSLSHQWSNLENATHAYMGSSADIYFSFGPRYRNNLVNYSVDSLIYCGYITDHAFAPVKERSERLRNNLRAKGAKFIVAFFDENSSDDPLSVITNHKSADTYRKFFELVLSEPSIGLVCKPGYPRTLRRRIAEVSALWDKAVTTGRCVFLDDGDYITRQYPTEAAQAADLSVNMLLSGTAALEAYLSGSPVIYLDLEGLSLADEYKYPGLVYDNLDRLVRDIVIYSREGGQAGLRSIDALIDAKDPFRDGRAAARIGSYLKWLLEKYNAGASPEAAIGSADKNYRDIWGNDMVVKGFMS